MRLNNFVFHGIIRVHKLPPIPKNLNAKAQSGKDAKQNSRFFGFTLAYGNYCLSFAYRFGGNLYDFKI